MSSWYNKLYQSVSKNQIQRKYIVLKQTNKLVAAENCGVHRDYEDWNPGLGKDQHPLMLRAVGAQINSELLPLEAVER